PLADLRRRRVSRAGARKLPDGPADCLDARARSPRLRILRPQHSRGERRGLLHLPRAGRQNAAHAQAELAADGMVPRLSQAPRALRAAPRGSLQHELRGARQSARAGPDAGRTESHPENDRLQHMSSMKFDTAPEFWRTLAEKDGANLDELVGDEFASRLPEPLDAVERRAFLKLMGASLALA